MHSSSLFFCFSLLVSLISGVAALGTIYRGDTRSPDVIKADGGFKARSTTGATSKKILDDHVGDTLGANDPFVSCSIDMEVSKTFGDYLYTLDSSKITNKIWDVNAVLEDPDEMFNWEKEQAVEHFVPWAAVISVQKKEGGIFKPINKPAKRAPFAHDARARAALESI
ncbi:hypothetical protein GQ44DRAFT_705260 [Phaeosphaeriaceae sp. PMI808]|nr:hypothetical protein GQ44DRAFT_705260 [Phaeosphaeriaceae sp. PMI808]